MAKAKRAPRRRAPRKSVRKNVRRSKRTVPERASLTVTRAFQLLNPNQTYRLSDVELSQYARAVNVAKAFQLYRIKNVKLIVSPLADTFQANAGASVPYIYFQVDRTRELDNVRTAQEFKQLGCKPHRLDDKIVIFQYRPSVLNNTLDNVGTGANAFNQYKISPWLRCRDEVGIPGVWNPDTTDHQGLVMFCENAGGANVQFKLEVMVEFEFMKPSYPMTITETAPEPVDVNTLVLSIPE